VSDTILFTVGARATYEPGLDAAEGTFLKLGRRKAGEHPNTPTDYPGGIVFETQAEAQAALEAGDLRDFSVYGLKTSLSNTYTLGGARYLIQDAEIVRLGGRLAQRTVEAEE
jgi:hypothetical protein